MSVIDAAIVRRLLHAQFPKIDATRVAYLNEGCDSVAFEVGDRLVFRFPKRADVEAQMATEQAVLEMLAAGGPPIAVPVIRYRGRPTELFPLAFAGYPKLPGQPAIRVPLSRDQSFGAAPVLGRFLSWLHAMPLDLVARTGARAQPLGTLLEEMRQEALEEFSNVVNTVPAAPHGRWRSWIEGADVADDGGGDRRLALVHNDLAAEHVLVDERTAMPTGVIDWSDVTVGDCAVDVAGIYHWGGEELARAVMEFYTGPFSARQHEQARFLAVCRGVLDVSFGIEHRRPEYIEAGLRALTLNAGT